MSGVKDLLGGEGSNQKYGGYDRKQNNQGRKKYNNNGNNGQGGYKNYNKEPRGDGQPYKPNFYNNTRKNNENADYKYGSNNYGNANNYNRSNNERIDGRPQFFCAYSKSNPSLDQPLSTGGAAIVPNATREIQSNLRFSNPVKTENQKPVVDKIEQTIRESDKPVFVGKMKIEDPKSELKPMKFEPEEIQMPVFINTKKVEAVSEPIQVTEEKDVNY